MASLPPPPAYEETKKQPEQVNFVPVQDKAGLSKFQKFGKRNIVQLGSEYEAVPFWLVRPKKRLTTTDRVRANMLNFFWHPKVATSEPWNPPVKQAQRCPFVSVDNFCFFYNKAMAEKGMEPHLVLGLWNKKVTIYGKTEQVEGLVLAGGGHYERMADKNTGHEEGDASLRDAADKELSEEIGIDRNSGGRIVTQEWGVIDDVLGEPRAHYLRFIYLRWIEQSPRPSDELSKVIAMPLSMVEKLARGEITWSRDGKEFGLELNHDVLIRTVLAHPDTLDFLANIYAECQYSRSPHPAVGAGAGAGAGAAHLDPSSLLSAHGQEAASNLPDALDLLASDNDTGGTGKEQDILKQAVLME